MSFFTVFLISITDTVLIQLQSHQDTHVIRFHVIHITYLFSQGASYTPGELNIFRHDSHSFCMYRTEISILK